MMARVYFIFLWVLVGVLGRLIPHLSNATPLMSLCLLSGTVFSRRFSLFLMFVILLLSDMALGWVYHYPLWGSWSLFTYSGFLFITFFGTLFLSSYQFKNIIILVMSASLFFWLWTNLGVWLLSGLYPKTLSGLFSCYAMAIPFLRNTLIGSLLWTLFLMITIRMGNKITNRNYRISH